MAACGGGCDSNVLPTAGAQCHAPQSRVSGSIFSTRVGGGVSLRAANGERLRDRRAVRSCPARAPRTASSLLGRSPCGDWGLSTSRSRDHTTEGLSATRLGRSTWPSDHSVAAVTISEASRRMTASFQSADWRSISMRIRGGEDAPARARRSVRARLEGHIPARTATDAALLVSELVTNSVVHANVGPGRALTVEITTLDDRLRIAVTDPGSRLRPRVRPPDPETPGGLGLLLVDELCETWGVWQDLGPTCVWCELRLDQSRPPVTVPMANGPTLRAV